MLINTLQVTKPKSDCCVLQSGDPPVSPQDRLERVWNQLEMPDSLKLDMAIKYSCNDFFLKLTEVGIYMLHI